MPLIEWSDQMQVHIQTIDQQHRRLVSLLNDLNDALCGGQDQKILSDAIAEMSDYTYYHFMTEEKYFDRFEYPHAEQHKNEHRYFVEKVTEFRRQFDDGETALTEDIILFLKSWVLNHIQKSDQKYGPFLVSKGLS